MQTRHILNYYKQIDNLLNNRLFASAVLLGLEANRIEHKYNAFDMPPVFDLNCANYGIPISCSLNPFYAGKPGIDIPILRRKKQEIEDFVRDKELDFLKRYDTIAFWVMQGKIMHQDFFKRWYDVGVRDKWPKVRPYLVTYDEHGYVDSVKSNPLWLEEICRKG